jgi:hypothetical protein
MRADPAWQAARARPRTQKKARASAFTTLRAQYGFSEYALHTYATTACCCWIAEHIDAVLAQTLATRAYRALNRVCLGHARRVRFKSRGARTRKPGEQTQRYRLALCASVTKARAITAG